MALITRGEIKDLLGINDTSRDNFIDKNLPNAESFLFSEFNNYFEVAADQLFLESDSVSFERGTPAKIKDSNNGFVDAGFKNGMVFRIKGSYTNDGVVPVTSVTPGELILKEDYNLFDEDYGLNVRLTIVRLPQEAKLFVAKLLEFNFPNKSNTEGVESERFDDYSIKYIIKNEIPQSIMAIMEPYRNLRWQ
jgi:hypothetical protein